MTPAYRQMLLKEKGITQKQIANEEGVSEMSISKEMNDGNVSDRLRRAIAKKLGLPVAKVFPAYYNSPPARSTSKVVAADN